MKLLAVSHACVTEINQRFYADVEALTGWSVSVVTPAVWSNAYSSCIVPSRLEALQGRLHMIPVWKAGSIPLHLYRRWLGTLLRQERPDAIYVHHEPYGLATFQVYLANAMSTQSAIGFYAAQNILKTYAVPFRWLEGYVMKRTDFCFPVTEGALAVLRAKGYTGRAQVLPLAVDQSVYRRRDVWAASRRAMLGIAPEEFVVGYLGRLVEEKGLHTLIAALNKMKRMDWRCVLVGCGPDEARLRSMVANEGMGEKFLLTGYVPHEEAPGWLSLFDVLVLASETRPHWKEQFGRVIVEANACGTAVIGSTCGEIPAVIASTGGGVVVPEAQPEKLAGALTRMMDHPAERLAMARLGQRSVEEQYGQARIVARFAAEIEEAVRQKQKNSV